VADDCISDAGSARRISLLLSWWWWFRVDVIVNTRAPRRDGDEGRLTQSLPLSVHGTPTSREKHYFTLIRLTSPLTSRTAFQVGILLIIELAPSVEVEDEDD